MKISIVTVCYNSESTIRDTIVSVLSQTHSDIEYIVIDGGSTDGTIPIVREYQDEIDVFISEPDEGIYDAMNKGLSLSTGEYVGIINSDDILFDDNVINDFVNFVLANNCPDAVYSDLYYVDQNNLRKLTRKYSFPKYKRWMARFGVMIPHPTFYIKRELLGRNGDYSLNYPVAADFEFMLRMMLSGVSPVYHNRVSVRMREGGVSNQGIAGVLSQNIEIVKACRDNGIYTNLLLVLIKLPYKYGCRLMEKVCRNEC